MNDLRVRKSNSIESDVVGMCLKNNIYDYYDVIKDKEYTWYKIREDMWVGDDGTYKVKLNKNETLIIK